MGLLLFTSSPRMLRMQDVFCSWFHTDIPSLCFSGAWYSAVSLLYAGFSFLLFFWWKSKNLCFLQLQHLNVNRQQQGPGHKGWIFSHPWKLFVWQKGNRCKQCCPAGFSQGSLSGFLQQQLNHDLSACTSTALAEYNQLHPNYKGDY